MCGIVGYIGFRNATKLLIESLKRLEYRGYDSAGVAVIDGKINIEKRKGYITNLNPKFNGNIGIGHTRWATHGKPSDINAHPFIDCTGNFAVVHNGIIENYMKLREDLIKKGHKFSSDTDSEVIVHLIEENYKDSFRDAFFKTVNMLKGSFAIVAIHNGERKIMGAKKESPLIIGIGDHENFVASDIPAFLKYTNRVITMQDGEVCELTDDFVRFYNFGGKEIKKDVEYINWSAEDAEKGGYEHFMLKEIYEEPEAIERTIHSLFSRDFRIKNNFDKIVFVACGTSYHASLIGKYAIEEILKIPVEVYYASEYRYRPEVKEEPLVILITQSGETADTIAAAKIAKYRGYRTIGITNVLGSSITNYVDNIIYTSAGPEIGVAATKTFITQIIAIYYLIFKFGYYNGVLSRGKFDYYIDILWKTPEIVEKSLLLEQDAIEEAEKLKKHGDIFYIAREINYPVAMEGALKMKEISYIHAEAYPAGELKHGPLALINEGTPVISIVSEDKTYDKMLSNIREVSARGAYVIALSPKEEVKKYVDKWIKMPEIDYIFSPIPNTVFLQLLAYHTAKILGREIDKPKNLAKSVTVE